MIYSTPVFDKYPRPKNREILQNKTKKKIELSFRNPNFTARVPSLLSEF